jgi:hypothetical protein
MRDTPKQFQVAPRAETERRHREIQLLLNVVEPDPEFQPFLLTDEASLVDAVGADAEVIQRRLDCYFGASLGIPLQTPLWRFVDEIKARRPGWPADDAG